jgi:hypothetical protein
LLLGLTTPLPSHIEKRSLLSKQKEMTQTGYWTPRHHACYSRA